MTIETKLLPLEVKATPDGVIEGYGSIYGNVDLGGEMVERGAFDETLASGKKIKMLWQHDQRKVIGVWDKVSSDDRGLKMTGRIAVNTTLGKDVAELAAMGAIDGLSIGFKTGRDEVKGGVRHIQKADLWEVSVVTFPMNPEARIDAVKAAGMTERELERVLTQDAGLSRSVARSLMGGGYNAIKAMQDAGDDRLDELRSLLAARIQ